VNEYTSDECQRSTNRRKHLPLQKTLLNQYPKQTAGDTGDKIKEDKQEEREQAAIEKRTQKKTRK